MTRHSMVWTAVGLAFLSCAHAPETPLPPVGPAWGIADEPAEFVVSGESRGAVSCRIDWGDGDTSIWTQWVTSGVLVATSHAWDAAGVYGISAQARSSDGALSNWSEPATVHVLSRPGFPTRMVGHAQLHGVSKQVELSQDGSRLFVLNDRGELAIVRTSDLTIERSGPGFDHGFSVGRDGQYVYGLRGQVVRKYRVTDLGLVDSLTFDDTLATWSLTASPVRDELYLRALTSGTGLTQILVVDGESLAVTGRMGRMVETYRPICSPDGQSLYVLDAASLYRFDIGTKALTGVVPVGEYPEIVAMPADGRHIYVADGFTMGVTLIDAPSFVVAEQLPEMGYYGHFAATPNGRFLFNRAALHGVDSVAVYKTGSWRLVAKFDPGQTGRKWSFLVPSLDGLRLYAASYSDSILDVVGF